MQSQHRPREGFCQRTGRRDKRYLAKTEKPAFDSGLNRWRQTFSSIRSYRALSSQTGGG
jgi:hypothetical protein